MQYSYSSDQSSNAFGDVFKTRADYRKGFLYASRMRYLSPPDELEVLRPSRRKARLTTSRRATRRGGDKSKSEYTWRGESDLFPTRPSPSDASSLDAEGGLSSEQQEILQRLQRSVTAQRKGDIKKLSFLRSMASKVIEQNRGEEGVESKKSQRRRNPSFEARKNVTNSNNKSNKSKKQQQEMTFADARLLSLRQEERGKFSWREERQCGLRFWVNDLTGEVTEEDPLKRQERAFKELRRRKEGGLVLPPSPLVKKQQKKKKGLLMMGGGRREDSLVRVMEMAKMKKRQEEQEQQEEEREEDEEERRLRESLAILDGQEEESSFDEESCFSFFNEHL